MFARLAAKEELNGAAAAAKDSGKAGSTSHGLAFLALLSFVSSFFSARIFATLNPNVVVVKGGIHFHHFWYGLVMLVVAGWFGIAYNRPDLVRIYAIVFGLGGGLLGDEVGLLLTFGDYNSTLTYFVFVMVVAIGCMSILFFGRRDRIRYDVIAIGRGERLAYVGVVIAGLSAVAFAAGLIPVGVIVVAVGSVVVILGLLWHRRIVSTTGH